MLEKPTQEQASTATQDTPPPAKTVLQDLTEAPVKSDEQLPEPLTNAGTSLTYDADWSRCEVSKQPIHQFTPPPDASDFYLKLKAVVQQEDLTQPLAQPPQSEKNYRNQQTNPISSAFICVHLCTLREGEAPTSVVPTPKLGKSLRYNHLVNSFSTHPRNGSIKDC
jgi:hypothetical protein